MNSQAKTPGNSELVKILGRVEQILQDGHLSQPQDAAAKLAMLNLLLNSDPSTSELAEHNYENLNFLDGRVQSDNSDNNCDRDETVDSTSHDGSTGFYYTSSDTVGATTADQTDGSKDEKDCEASSNDSESSYSFKMVFKKGHNRSGSLDTKQVPHSPLLPIDHSIWSISNSNRTYSPHSTDQTYDYIKGTDSWAGSERSMQAPTQSVDASRDTKQESINEHSSVSVDVKQPSCTSITTCNADVDALLAFINPSSSNSLAHDTMNIHKSISNYPIQTDNTNTFSTVPIEVHKEDLPLNENFSQSVTLPTETGQFQKETQNHALDSSSMHDSNLNQSADFSINEVETGIIEAEAETKPLISQPTPLQIDKILKIDEKFWSTFDYPVSVEDLNEIMHVAAKDLMEARLLWLQKKNLMLEERLKQNSLPPFISGNYSTACIPPQSFDIAEPCSHTNEINQYADHRIASRCIANAVPIRSFVDKLSCETSKPDSKEGSNLIDFQPLPNASGPNDCSSLDESLPSVKVRGDNHNSTRAAAWPDENFNTSQIDSAENRLDKIEVLGSDWVTQQGMDHHSQTQSTECGNIQLPREQVPSSKLTPVPKPRLEISKTRENSTDANKNLTPSTINDPQFTKEASNVFLDYRAGDDPIQSEEDSSSDSLDNSSSNKDETLVKEEQRNEAIKAHLSTSILKPPKLEYLDDALADTEKLLHQLKAIYANISKDVEKDKLLPPQQNINRETLLEETTQIVNGNDGDVDELPTANHCADLHRVSSSGAEMTLDNFRLSMDEIDELESKCNHLNNQQFQDSKDSYHQVASNIINIELLLESIRNLPQTPQLRNKLAQLREVIRFNNEKEANLERKLREIASRKSDIFPEFSCPQAYGDNDDFDPRVIETVPKFNPKNPAHSFSKTWTNLKIAARGSRGDRDEKSNLSKLGFKKALLFRLEGDAHQYMTKIFDRDLTEIITLLGHRFEKHKTKEDYDHDLRCFTVNTSDTLLQNIERLRALIMEVHSEKSPEELKIVTDMTIRDKIPKMVSPEVLKETLLNERLSRNRATPFNFIDEIINQNNIMGARKMETSLNSKTPMESLNAMINPRRTPSPHIRHSSPNNIDFSRGGNITKRSTSNSPLRTSLQPSGAIKVGDGQVVIGNPTKRNSTANNPQFNSAQRQRFNENNKSQSQSIPNFTSGNAQDTHFFQNSGSGRQNYDSGRGNSSYHESGMGQSGNFNDQFGGQPYHRPNQDRYNDQNLDLRNFMANIMGKMQTLDSQIKSLQYKGNNYNYQGNGQGNKLGQPNNHSRGGYQGRNHYSGQNWQQPQEGNNPNQSHAVSNQLAIDGQPIVSQTIGFKINDLCARWRCRKQNLDAHTKQYCPYNQQNL